MQKSGKILITSDLGDTYGFTDLDGKFFDSFYIFRALIIILNQGVDHRALDRLNFCWNTPNGTERLLGFRIGSNYQDGCLTLAGINFNNGQKYIYRFQRSRIYFFYFDIRIIDQKISLH